MKEPGRNTHCHDRSALLRTTLIILIITLLALAATADPPSPPPTPNDALPVSGGNTNVTLLTPADNAYFKTAKVNFSFQTATDFQNCSIVLDDNATLRLFTAITAETPIQWQDLYTPTGAHYWQVICVDDTGSEEWSTYRSFIIDTAQPVLIFADSTLTQGDDLLVNGSHYLPGDVDLNLSNTSGIIDETSATVDNLGTFSSSLFMKYSYPPGTYTLATSQDGYAAATTATFTLTQRAVKLTTDKESYNLGETVTLAGTGFSAGAPIDLFFVKPDGGTYDLYPTPIADGNGSFTATYTLTGNRAAGNYNVTATDNIYSTLVATTTFTLEAGTQPAAKDPCPLTDKCLVSQPTNGVEEDYACTGSSVCYACAPGDHWDGSSCVADLTCTAQCQSGQWQCVSTQIQYCAAAVNGCWLWGQGQNCPDGQQCVAGAGCSTPNLPTLSVQQKPSFLGGLSLLFILALGLLLIFGGAVGYLAYEGKLDFHDLGGSLRSLLHPEARGPAGQADPDETSDMKHFIFSERAQGYDDLTVRNALVQRGWSETAVDRVFQEIYTE